MARHPFIASLRKADMMDSGIGTKNLLIQAILIFCLITAILVSLGIGRYHIPVSRVMGICVSKLWTLVPFWTDTDQRVVLLIRMPRILMTVLIGAGLSISGAGLQGVFRNPLVGPQIIGVSSGAAFGGVLAILLFENMFITMSMSFVFGLTSILVVFVMSRTSGRSPVLMLVLSGVVANAFFTALISFLKYVADPYDKLPAIVFWLMGSLALVTYEKLQMVIVPMVTGCFLIYLMRFRINVLSLGDEEAQSLGVKVAPARWVILVCVTIISASAVSVCGIIGWVGLVVPHLARMIVGPDHRVLLPVAGPAF